MAKARPEEVTLDRVVARFSGQHLAIYEEAIAQYAARRPQARVDGPGDMAAVPIDRQGSVAVIDCVGVMVPRAEWWDEVSTERVAAQLASAAADPSIDAILLRIDSPGGLAVGQFELEAAAREAAQAKPLVAHVEGLCCSAGYWLASCCEAIYATESSQIGSIGVRSHLWDWSEYFANVGVRVVSAATGEFKAMGLTGTEITEAQEAWMKSQTDWIFARFKTAVLDGRGFEAKAFDGVGDGRVWYAIQALEVGLIDGVQTFSKTLAGLSGGISSAGSAGTTKRSQTMAKEIETDGGPKAASLAELKKAFPKASADFYLEQVEADATMTDAAIAYANLQEAAAEAARNEAAEAKADAEKAAAEAAKVEKTAPKRGAPALGGGAAAADPEAIDYRELARKEMVARKIRWSEACLLIKKRYGNAARAAFGAPLDREEATAATDE